MHINHGGNADDGYHAGGDKRTGKEREGAH